MKDLPSEILYEIYQLTNTDNTFYNSVLTSKELNDKMHQYKPFWNQLTSKSYDLAHVHKYYNKIKNITSTYNSSIPQYRIPLFENLNKLSLDVLSFVNFNDLLSKCPNITTLELNIPKDIAFNCDILCKLTKLETVRIKSYDDVNIDALSFCNKLKHVTVIANNITGFLVLSSQSIETLNLIDGCRQKKVINVIGCKKIQDIYVSSMTVNNIKSLVKLNSLIVLDAEIVNTGVDLNDLKEFQRYKIYKMIADKYSDSDSDSDSDNSGVYDMKHQQMIIEYNKLIDNCYFESIVVDDEDKKHYVTDHNEISDFINGKLTCINTKANMECIKNIMNTDDIVVHYKSKTYDNKRYVDVFINVCDDKSNNVGSDDKMKSKYNGNEYEDTQHVNGDRSNQYINNQYINNVANNNIYDKENTLNNNYNYNINDNNITNNVLTNNKHTSGDENAIIPTHLLCYGYTRIDKLQLNNTKTICICNSYIEDSVINTISGNCQSVFIKDETTYISDILLYSKCMNFYKYKQQIEVLNSVREFNEEKFDTFDIFHNNDHYEEEEEELEPGYYMIDDYNKIEIQSKSLLNRLIYKRYKLDNLLIDTKHTYNIKGKLNISNYRTFVYNNANIKNIRCDLNDTGFCKNLCLYFTREQSDVLDGTSIKEKFERICGVHHFTDIKSYGVNAILNNLKILVLEYSDELHPRDRLITKRYISAINEGKLEHKDIISVVYDSKYACNDYNNCRYNIVNRGEINNYHNSVYNSNKNTQLYGNLHNLDKVNSHKLDLNLTFCSIDGHIIDTQYICNDNKYIEELYIRNGNNTTISELSKLKILSVTNNEEIVTEISNTKNVKYFKLNNVKCQFILGDMSKCLYFQIKGGEIFNNMFEKYMKIDNNEYDYKGISDYDDYDSSDYDSSDNKNDTDINNDDNIYINKNNKNSNDYDSNDKLYNTELYNMPLLHKFKINIFNGIHAKINLGWLLYSTNIKVIVVYTKNIDNANLSFLSGPKQQNFKPTVEIGCFKPNGNYVQMIINYPYKSIKYKYSRLNRSIVANMGEEEEED